MKRLGFILLCILFLSGCVQQQIIDELNIETGLGFDLQDENTLRGTVLYPQFHPDKSISNTTLVAKAKVSRDLISKLELQSNRPLVTGSLSVVLFGRELAERGFFHLIDSLQRDPNIGSRIDLAVVDGEATDVLNGVYGSEGNGVFIKDLLDHNMRYRDLPRLNLHVFGSYFYSETRTTYLPILKKISNNDLKINGIALFNKKRLVQTLEPKHMFFFKLLVDEHSQGSQTVKLDGAEAVVRSVDSSREIEVNKKQPDDILINIKINGVIREYTGANLTAKKSILIRKKYEEKVKKEVLEMLKEFQKNSIDPVGIGERVKNHTRHFNPHKWKDDYPNIHFTINTDVKIMESGTVE